MNRKVLLLTLAFLLIPVCTWAEGVIGVDHEFQILPINFLVAKTSEEEPYVLAFNYFFTIEIFVGLLALWLRWCMRVMRM